jgi:hypothetical protein
MKATFSCDDSSNGCGDPGREEVGRCLRKLSSNLLLSRCDPSYSKRRLPSHDHPNVIRKPRDRACTRNRSALELACVTSSTHASRSDAIIRKGCSDHDAVPPREISLCVQSRSSSIQHCRILGVAFPHVVSKGEESRRSAAHQRQCSLPSARCSTTGAAGANVSVRIACWI